MEHYFVTKEEFDKLKKEKESDILAYTKIGDVEYMALINELDTANFYIIDPLGLKNLKERMGDRIPNIIPIYITAHLNERIYRAKRRSDFETSFKKRVIAETDQFTNFLFDYADKTYFTIKTDMYNINACNHIFEQIVYDYIPKSK